MDGIYTTGNVLITDHISDEVPNKEAYLITNRLLDGSWHMQTIGEPAAEIDLAAYTELSGLQTLNTLQATGTQIKIIARGQSYEGYIQGKIAWAETAPGYYQGTMKILIAGV